MEGGRKTLLGPVQRITGFLISFLPLWWKLTLRDNLMPKLVRNFHPLLLPMELGREKPNQSQTKKSNKTCYTSLGFYFLFQRLSVCGYQKKKQIMSCKAGRIRCLCAPCLLARKLRAREKNWLQRCIASWEVNPTDKILQVKSEKRRVWVADHGDCKLPWKMWSILGIIIVSVSQWLKKSKDKSGGFRKASLLSTSGTPLD